MRFPVLLVGTAALFVVAGPFLVSRAVADDATTCDEGSGDEAIAACTRMIRLDPKYADAYYWRGRAKQDNGDASGGDADIATAKQLNPNVGN